MTLVVVPHLETSKKATPPISSAPPPNVGVPKETMPRPKQHPIPSATLLSSTSHPVPGQLLITELTFRVPLDYAQPDGQQITLFGRRAQKCIRPLTNAHGDGSDEENSKPYIVYLEGGPGFGNRAPQDHPLTRPALTRGYQVLMLDHRGTGMSTPVGAEMLAHKSTDEQVEYLKLMRQDNTVRDCEAVRKCLLEGQKGDETKWSIFGQSYGGFVAMSYLSMHPEGLKEVYLTGGLAPVKRNADEVYTALLPRVAKRSEEYYAKFPEDVKNVWDIANYITEKKGGKVALPSGGVLTVARLLTIGIAFGGHGGFDGVHSTILQLKNALDTFGFLTRASLAPLESYTPFDTNIIYAILHEAIYCNGPGYASNWASQRIGEQHPSYPWLKETKLSPSDGPLYFSGENIFPFDFETYPELSELRAAAHKLAKFDQWEYLYDLKQLSRNEVPVYAASYVDDMYVDSDFARETARLVQGTRVFETNIMYHNALRAKADEVLQQLFNLRDDVMD